jgi:hypothetical protein
MITIKRLTLGVCLPFIYLSAAAAQLEVRIGGVDISKDPSHQVSIAYKLNYTTSDVGPTSNPALADKITVDQLSSWISDFNKAIANYHLQKGSTITLGYYDSKGDKIIPKGCENIALKDSNHIQFSTESCSS